MQTSRKGAHLELIIASLSSQNIFRFSQKNFFGRPIADLASEIEIDARIIQCFYQKLICFLTLPLLFTSLPRRPSPMYLSNKENCKFCFIGFSTLLIRFDLLLDVLKLEAQNFYVNPFLCFMLRRKGKL